ncbi:DNA translocase FtsK 4TM domain-containing protein [Panacibacter sp. DH6]|uniref:DNA translocase FtsK 4TM domain-containing protein n=1 Tax=Panacibacter microcysteis TaxID=2793269 RepID=A0A931GZC7_9BACT|nr:DNA translocase FtsK [Panacibacter microcysteis]MBG9378133.1 DNA translocase FtsK 4TM domain-containing protein [Panacibacter microcysteis]
MANKLKKKTPPPAPDPAKLKEDKEAKVTVTEVVKDERTTKIAGAVSLLVAIFLFIAFTSYIFTWKEDQDMARLGVGIFTADDVKVTNLLGALGAYISHTFIANGFGLASYLFCTFFFVLGVNLLFGKKVYSLARNLRYLILGLLVISVALAFPTKGAEFSWGGATGEMMSDWLVKVTGKVGTTLILALAVLSYVIWRFNPVFKMPQRKPRTMKAAPPPPAETDEAEAEEMLPVYPFAKGDPGVLETGDAVEDNNNKLKNGGKNISVIMPKQQAVNEDPMIAFEVNEKEIAEDAGLVTAIPPKEINDLYAAGLMKEPLADEEEPATGEPVAEPVTVKTPRKNATPQDMELEIKQTVDDEIVDTEAEADMEDNDDAFDSEAVDDAGKANEEDEKVYPFTNFKIPDGDYEPTLELRDYKFPALDLLEAHGSEKIVHDPAELEANKNQIIATLKNYDIAIQRIAATVGPTVTLYEIVPAPGVRISRIKNLEDDIALSLAALGIRIIAPIPGKGTIGIEVPNVRKTVVSMKTLLASDKFQHNSFALPIAIGKKIDNENFIVDLASMPHLLMAGATGQGKSVGINALLVSLLYKKHPSQLKFVLVDPKKVELSIYRVIEKHFLAKLPGEEESIITDTKKVVYTLNALCIEMDNRYDLLKEAGCRNIKEYNEKFVKRKLNPQKGHQFLPFIVLVVDEFADLIMTAGKEVEMPIARLAQLARAVGIHLIIATQRPSVNIITGTIKANFPARIAFKVSSKIDSRTILDAGGAEQLIGKGDMLVSYNGEITRLQCAFVDTPEVDRVVDFIGDQRGYPQAFLLPEYVDEKEMEGKDFDVADRDPLFEDAARLIVQNQMGSTSLIQRRMKLGYNRAGRLMDQLEAAGIVGKNLGSKARDVLVHSETELEEILGGF